MMFTNQQKILRLNSAGYPVSWVSYETAARLYYTNQVSYECGSSSMLLRGGYNRLTQLKSKLKVNSIIATHDINKLDFSALRLPCQIRHYLRGMLIIAYIVVSFLITKTYQETMLYHYHMVV